MQLCPPLSDHVLPAASLPLALIAWVDDPEARCRVRHRSGKVGRETGGEGGGGIETGEGVARGGNGPGDIE